ncbi:MAG: DNA primase [Pseudopedobacter saltans]|uniref:DNA primase n=1 Tax=Pseudopedobacter saltans TaxID=151895 RepID=A0A2W5F1X3_9SPHI|nr:MAG: DNA primase [Pseudopedobacter saltans]
MQNERFNFKTAKEQIDLVDYLSSLGHQPTKQNNAEYWYLSPLHEEHTASFKIDSAKQIWYDHGTGQGGDLIDFIKVFHHCDFKEALVKLKEYLNIQEPENAEKQHENRLGKEHFNKDSDNNKHIHILAERPIQKHYLKQYIQSRDISIALAERYLKEVDYSLYGKNFTALGFPNDAGGYELRNKYFKGSSMPKAPTVILLNEKQKPLPEQKLAVFEGFFSMLSFLELLEKGKLFAEKPDNILVLNSLSFLNKSKDLIISYGQIDLYLDGDAAGQKATEQALSWSENINDRSYLYEGFKDLNTYLCAQNLVRKESFESVKTQGLRR